MTRQDVEALVKQIYAARLMNDPARLAALFTPDGSFHLAGESGPGRVSALVSGQAGLGEMMRVLCDNWIWLDHTVLDLLIEGDRAAVRHRTKMRFVPTGDVIDTELMDLITFASGKITSFVEFCDTAMACGLVGKAQR